MEANLTETQPAADHRRRQDDTILNEVTEVLYGNRRTKYTGVLERLENVEKVVAEYQRLKFMLQGALILMGLLTVTNIGALAILANFLAKALAVLP